MEPVVPADFPKPLIEVALINGEEAAWLQEDCLKAIDWFSHNGYAILRFELWLSMDGGIPTAISTKTGPAIYVYDFNWRKDEIWQDYVERSAREAAGHIGAFGWPEDSLEPQRQVYFNLPWADREWFRTLEKDAAHTSDK